MSKHITPVTYHKDSFQIEWLSDKYINFKKGKQYIAAAFMKHIHNGQYSNFKITDEDSDYVALSEKDRNKKWRQIKD